MAATRTHTQAIDERNTQTATMSYAILRAGDAHPLLRGERRRSIAGPGRIGSGNQEEFGASDFQMGMLTGLPFAIFYSLMGIPIAAWADRSNRRNVLVMAVATWSGMTALFGTAVNFTMLFLTRIGTRDRRSGRQSAVAFAHLRLLSEGPARDGICHLRAGGAGGHVHRRGDWGMGQSKSGMAEHVHRDRNSRHRPGHHRVPHREGTTARDVRWCGQPRSKSEDPGMWEVLRFLWLRASFRHLSLACALHSVVCTRAALSTTRFCSVRTG